MKITRESIDNLNSVIRLVVEKADYEKKVEKTIKEHRKKANIPGFRAGMAPTSVIKKMYGKAILSDEVGKLVNSSLYDYITKEGINPLGEPLHNQDNKNLINWDSDESFEFAFDIAVASEFKIELSKDIKLPHYIVKIDKTLIDERIDAYTNEFSKSVPADEVSEEEIVYGDFIQLDNGKKVQKGGIETKDAAIYVKYIKDEDIKKSFAGKKVGDTLCFNPLVAYDNNHKEVSHMLNIDADMAEKLETDFSFTIKKITKLVPSEINESLFKGIFGEKTDIKSEDEFRKSIGEQLNKQFENSCLHLFGTDAKKALTKKAGVELPEAFLKRWLKSINENTPEERIEEGFPEFCEATKWSIIKNRIAKENDIKISEDDVNEAAVNIARMRFSQYGINNVPDEHLGEYAKKLIADSKEKNELIARKVEEKVLDLVREKVTLEDKVITQEEFKKLFER